MRQLGDLEAVVMDRLWSWHEPASVRRVMEDLHQERPLAYTTIMTVLENLHRKGFVTREKEGRAYNYRPVRSREQHTAAIMNEVLAGSHDSGAALLHFVEEMTPEERARLRAVVEDLTPTRKKR